MARRTGDIPRETAASSDRGDEGALVPQQVDPLQRPESPAAMIATWPMRGGILPFVMPQNLTETRP